MELKELRGLIALAELGTLTLAAEHLHLSPAAIHKQLKVLEQELGVRLYEKVGRNLQLTGATEALLPHLKEMMVQYDSAVAALAAWKGVHRGIIRIGTGPTIGAYLLPVLIKKFRRSFPGLELLVETGNTPVLLDSLSKGALDLALVVSSDLLEGENFSIECHWDFELALVTHQRQSPTHVRLADLSHSRFILFKKGSRMEEPIDRYFASHGLKPNVIMRFDNSEAIKAMISSGLGISMLPIWIVDSDLKRGRLTLIRQAEPPLCSKVALVSRRTKFVPRAVQSFIEHARAVVWTNPRLVLSQSRLSPRSRSSPG